MTDSDLAARRPWFDHRQNMRRHNKDAWDAEYKALTGERVTPTQSPSMSVIVNTVGHGRLALALPVADPIRPRIDTVCRRGGTVQVIHGTPSVLPEPPHAPAGWETVAHVRIPANATSLPSANIEGVHP